MKKTILMFLLAAVIGFLYCPDVGAKAPPGIQKETIIKEHIVQKSSTLQAARLESVQEFNLTPFSNAVMIINQEATMPFIDIGLAPVNDSYIKTAKYKEIAGESPPVSKQHYQVPFGLVC